MEKIKGVSIIIPVLNSGNDLEKTLISISKQEGVKYEIIIQDCNSSDNTFEISNNFTTRYFKEKDSGLYDAFNRGIHKSNYDWIYFIGAGDVFYNKYSLNNLFKKTSDGVKVVYGHTLYKKENIFFIDRLDKLNFEKGMPFCHQSAIFNKQVFKNNMFSLRYKFASDFNHLIKIIEHKNEFAYSNQIVAIYELNGISYKNRKQTHFEKNLIKFNNKKINYLKFIFNNLKISIYYFFN